MCFHNCQVGDLRVIFGSWDGEREREQLYHLAANSVSYVFLIFSHVFSKRFLLVRPQEYTELSGVNLASLLVAGLVSTALIVSILLLVYLGNEALYTERGQMFGVAIYRYWTCELLEHKNNTLKNTRTHVFN